VSNFQFKQRGVQKGKQVARLIGRIKLSNLMELSEDDFENLLREIKSSKIFQKLLSSQTCKAIRLKRFSHSSFFELNEALFSGKRSLDIESCLSGKDSIIKEIRNLGIEKFKKYFIDENYDSDLEIKRNCGLSTEEINSIRGFLDELFINEEFFQNSPYEKNRINGVYYTMIASIVKEKEKYSIRYANVNHYPGKYVIDYEKIEELKKQHFFSRPELIELGKLLKNLESINKRNHLIHRILESIVEHQSSFLNSGDPLDLIPLTQRELGRIINASPSHISRTIRYKTVTMPWGEEIKLPQLFPNKKTVVKRHIVELLDENRNQISDNTIKQELEKVLNFPISRRSIAYYRNELNIGSSFKKSSDD